MGDIDLVVDLLDERARRGLGNLQQDISRVRVSAAQTSSAFSGMFREIQQGGTISAETMVRLGGVIAQMGTPLGAAGAAIGLLATVISDTVGAVQRLKKEELQRHMREIAAATKKAREEWDTYFRVVSEGGSEEEAALRQSRENNLRRFQQQKEMLEGLIAEGEVTVTALTKQLAGAHNQFSRSIIEGQIEEWKRAIAGYKARLEELAQTTGQTVNKIDSMLKPTSAEALSKPAAADEQNAGFLDNIPQAREDVQGLGFDLLIAEARAQSLRDHWKGVTDDMKLMAKDAFADVMVGAFNAYADALDRTISLNAIFAGGFDRALRNMAASTVRSVGQQATVKGAFEVAEAFASLARYDGVGFAGHMKAAGAYFAVAATAGVAAGALSVNAGGAAGGGVRLPGANPDGTDRGGPSPTFQLILLGAPDASVKDEIARWVRDAMEGRDV